VFADDPKFVDYVELGEMPQDKDLEKLASQVRLFELSCSVLLLIFDDFVA